jgi:lipopolysaccharide/colanic/teichoic acid biosynthesis glycosyltransferase
MNVGSDKVVAISTTNFLAKSTVGVTRIGKYLRRYSLDELPQLWNVVLGDMALVGPRPCLEVEMKHWPIGSSGRLTVLPGLTGLWQVRSRHNSTPSDYFADDLEYVANKSIGLDISILFRTVKVLLLGTGT